MFYYKMTLYGVGDDPYKDNLIYISCPTNESESCHMTDSCSYGGDDMECYTCRADQVFDKEQR